MLLSSIPRRLSRHRRACPAIPTGHLLRLRARAPQRQPPDTSPATGRATLAGLQPLQPPAEDCISISPLSTCRRRRDHTCRARYRLEPDTVLALRARDVQPSRSLALRGETPLDAADDGSRRARGHRCRRQLLDVGGVGSCRRAREQLTGAGPGPQPSPAWCVAPERPSGRARSHEHAARTGRSGSPTSAPRTAETTGPPRLAVMPGDNHVVA
jgi:hypothetical protein